GELLQRALVVRYWLAIAWRFRVYRISGGEFLVMASGSQSWASVVGTDDTDLSVELGGRSRLVCGHVWK
ncbi:hypothetical protein LINPERHAP2_LOCUS36513, partial [Linum perenne]